ncbi:MAG: ABC transporter ATP-binding protein [Microbacterium sp.]|uniref:ABC transporter ATP-binding protein n=1 Tax=Microbacterium sp. TaxID=51671 RepID=UPI001AC2CD2E|nr:ABC transporter ATP-binding protein [Microbacterium sp.]MBN9154211.1 ABC transporter ATP-binding protein [Microbacterium sp.]
MRSLYVTLRQVLRILPGKAERFYLRFVVFASALALLDIVSMAIIALVMTPALTGTPITVPLIGTIPLSATVWLIAIACGLIMVKGASTVAMQWWATRRLAVYELEIGDRLFGAYTQLTWEERASRKTSDLTRVADTGIANTIMGFLIPLSSIPPNVVSFFSVAVVLFVAKPLSALAVMAYLIAVAIFMSRFLSKKVAQAGRVNRTYAYRAAGVLTELVEALKEFTLRDRLGAVRQHVRDIRVHAARGRANISFLSIVPRYAMESALMFGLLIVGGVSLATSGFQQAIVAIALFTITGFRMLPAINTVQSSLTTASANEIHAKNVVADILSAETAVHEAAAVDTLALPANPRELVLEDVGFRYSRTSPEVLEDVNLRIRFGGTLGIAGPTGAGKSTLVDILLGLSVPTTGTVAVDGVPISAALHSWRSRVAYVPQSVSIFSATIAQNVALTWGDDFDPERVERALHRAQLDDVLRSRPEGINSMLTERGSNLSGGQRQRLGIARALYSDPLVLVLDEATSALDGRTEEAVAEAIRGLQGDVTVVAVAHRLATIRHFDTIAYLDGGHVVATGSFDELQRAVPDFRVQARLAGLEVAGA